MKNLKKVLALVLALATVMGLGITASAKTYTDSSKIEYTEAVDVMSAIDVLGGMPDGSFNPQGNLTREQAAKMVSYLLNGGKDVNKLYEGSNTFTDCYSSWAKGYIAYVNQMGIVSGVGNGKFNPKGTLTGVQLAKMMLTSLGYDAKIEGYQGSNNWQVNIINDAQNAGLLKGMDTVNLYAAITREQASQMMFNALKADMVGYESKGTEIELPGIGTIVTGASDPKPVAQGSYRNNMHENDTETSKQTLQMAEKYFGGNKGLELTSKASYKDDFGRPAHNWKYDNKDIGDYADEADVTYTAKVKGKDIYKDLGKVSSEDVTVYTDGESNKTSNKDISADSSDEFGGQGTKTEVFVDNSDKNPVITVVETNTYVGTINKYTAATDTDDAYITITNKGIEYNGQGSKDYTFKTDAFSKDDKDSYVLYTMADGKIKSVTVPTSVEGSVSKYGENNDAIVVNGTSYKLAAKHKLFSNTDFDSTYTFYLDANGNVIFSEVVEAGAQNYAYVTRIEESANLSTGTGVLAEVYLTDGTKAVVDVAVSGKKYAMPKNNGDVAVDGDGKGTEKVDGNVDNTGKATADVNYWFSYTVNSDKEYTFKKLDADYAQVQTTTVELDKDKANQVVTGKYTTADTVVSVFDKEDEFSTATGLIDATLDGGKLLVTYGKDSSAITAVYAVGVKSGVTTGEVTYAYAVKKDGKTSDGDSWTFVIDGKEVSYTVENGTPTSGGVYTLNMSDKGTVKSFSSDKGVKNEKVNYVDKNTVAVGDNIFQTTDDFAVYNVADGDGAADSLEKGDTITYVLESGKIAIAFITKEA